VAKVLCDALIANSAIDKMDKSQIFDERTGLVYARYRRGYLTVLNAALSRMGCSVVFAGTEFSMADADRVYPSIGKPERIVKITSFPLVRDPTALFQNVLDLSNCRIDDEHLSKLIGRARFVAKVIAELFAASDNPKKTKQEVLKLNLETRLLN